MNIGIPLHNHSEGSFLDGYATVEQIAKRTAEIGAPAFAITDHGEVNQHMAAQKAAEKHGLKFIPGIEGYLVDSIERVRREQDRQNSHLCLFATDNLGLRNLWSLSSKAYIEGRYRKPLVDWEMLNDHGTSGLIATDGCLLAYMARAILEDDNDAAGNLIGQYVDTFGRDNFFMELHTFQFIEPRSEKERVLNEQMTKMNQGKAALAKKYNVPLIVVNDSHYANECDWQNHALVWDMSVYDKDGDKTSGGQTAAWIMDDSEMHFWMEKHGIGKSVIDQALQNTAEIASRCTAKIEGRLHLPSLTGSPEGDRKLFLDRIQAGFQERIVEKGLDVEVYSERLEEEIELITDKQFDGYFNIVSDYVQHAKYDRKMLVGAGRGSGGGSLVNYCMGITNVDPIKYNLLFSRFLNPARVDMPDIDVDFPQSRRKEMTEGYLIEKYGADRVCLIGTLSRSQPKGILGDLCRAMKIDFNDSKDMSKILDKAYLPQGIDAHEAWELMKDQLLTPDHRQAHLKQKPLDPWRDKYPHLFVKIDEMVGLIRQSSTHAAGVIISDVPLWGEIPLRIKGSSDDMPITQFENSETKSGNPDVSELGYIKYDFLGLRTLDTLTEVYELVNEKFNLGFTNVNDYYDNFGDKEYADAKAWLAVGLGDTLGVFQIETNNALAPTKRMKPLNEVDMADLTSVIRPGVVKAGLLDEYFDRKDGITEYKSIHPMLDEILGRTFGIVVYQEQALKIFLQIANYAPAEAEKVRKMIGKKKVQDMEAEKPRFAQRCLDNAEFMRQIPAGSSAQKIITEMWNSIEATGSYAFNEAHAIGYSLTACQCAYMKATYPEEYFTALLRTDPEKIPMYIRQIRKRGYNILPPDINESGENFTLTPAGIRYGLTAVFSVASAAVKEIVKHRPYASFESFLDKVSKRACNARVIKNLISIGAFDNYGERADLLATFFDIRKIKDELIPDFSDEAVVQEIEMKLVGSYIVKDPMERYTDLIEGECIASPNDLDELQAGQLADIGGQIISVKHHNTKTKNEPMCFMQVSWNEEIFEVVVFPRQFAGYKIFIKEGAPVFCRVEKLEKGCCLKELIRLDKVL